MMGIAFKHPLSYNLARQLKTLTNQNTALCLTIRYNSKGGKKEKNKTLLSTLRQKIVDTYEAGNTSIRKVAERFQVNKSTVQALLKRKKETGKLFPSQAKEGKPSLLFGHEQQIEEMVAQYPDYTRFRIL
jgi:predicted DNA-binding protein YlxM (UPF0122 family)